MALTGRMPIPTSSEQHGDAELASVNAVTSRSHVLEYLRKESLDIFNRLHSIAEDAAFVEHAHQAYSTIPLLGEAYSPTAGVSRLTSLWS
jgi:hypothetical protein